MPDMLNILKMIQTEVDNKANEESRKWGKMVYADEFDALRHAHAIACLKPGQILSFEYDDKCCYGVFYGGEEGAIAMYRFSPENSGIVKAKLSPDSILEILDMTELEARLADEERRHE